jgi:gamma-butyrobetaine dioxygenase
MLDELAARGYAVVARPVPDEPWACIHELAGRRPEMVERQPIRPIPDARSFAGGAMFTPFHTDSQDYLGAPPGLQVMVCRRPAVRGGETRLVDGWAVLDQLAAGDRALFDALLEVPRTQRFYFGDVTGPTVADKRGHLVWTHSPLPPADPIGSALAAALGRAPVIELAIRAGETLVVDNHRMLHGRRAFDGDRDFVRLLAWFARPLVVHPRYRARSEPPRGSRLDVVLELVTGVPPARLAAREGVTEAELYAWRSRALAAAKTALED